MITLARLCTVGAVAFSSILAAGDGLIAAPSFDGNYSVDVRTERGTCNPSTHITLVVMNGRVTALAGLPITASGAVSGKGVVALNLAYNGEQASVIGHMKGASGDGTWSSKPTACGGRWHAERLG